MSQPWGLSSHALMDSGVKESQAQVGGWGIRVWDIWTHVHVAQEHVLPAGARVPVSVCAR